MMRGIFALFFRSLRGDARSLWVHGSWLVLLLVIYGAMWYAQRMIIGAPGLLFFTIVIFTNAIFISLLGIGYFSSAISEEKEEDTLGLMTMAGISPLGVLLGKSTTRLFQVFILLAVQYPFTLLAVTLGGLMPDQIYAAYAALLAYTILLANMALFCSVICQRNRDASALTSLAILGYVTTPMFAFGGYMFFLNGDGASSPRWANMKRTWEPILHWISQTSVFGQLFLVTETGYEFKLTPQLTSNCVLGICLFFVSWWLFEVLPQDAAVEKVTRPAGARGNVRLGWLRAGRSWNRALIWKDFHFISGGWPGILSRVLLYLGLYWLAFAAMFPWGLPKESRQINWRDVTYGYQYFVVPFFAVDCALCLSRLFQEEIRQQTLASLLMLPRSVIYVTYSKIAGCLLGVVPGMIAIFASLFLLEGSTKSLQEFTRGYGTWFILANLLLTIHLSAMFSTYLRWGAFMMSLVVAGSAIFLNEVLINFLRLPFKSAQLLMGAFCIPIIIACIVCHLVILLRLPQLGEK